MGLLVRETPPTRVSWVIETPGGPSYRLGGDDPNPNNVPDGASWDTTIPGGFDTASLTLERDPRINWPDLQELSTVTAYGLGGSVVAYQGRLEEYPSQAGSDSNFTLTLGGWQNHLQDNSGAAELYIDGDLGNWTSPGATRQQNLVAAGYQLGDTEVGADPNNGGTPVPALVQTITDSWASAGGGSPGYYPVAEAWYNPPPGCLIAKVYYSVDSDADVGGVSGWIYEVFLASNNVASSIEGTGDLSSGSKVAALFVPGTAQPFAMVQLVYSATPGGLDGAQYDCYWDALQVIGNHGLTLQGDGPYGLLASDVIAHAVGNWAPLIDYTTGSSGTIQPSSFVIPQLVFTPTTVLAIIQQAVEYELLDYAVWEATTGTSGPTLFVNAFGARGRQWVSRVGPAQLQNAGPQMSRVFNGVVVQFTAPDGTTQTVGPPGSSTTAQDSSLVDSDPTNPANIVGIDRWYLLQMGSSTQAGAIQAGAYYLATQAELNTSGQASLVGHAQDYLTGSWWPAWMVRAGDTISFVDAADTSFRRISGTSYDDTTRTNTIQLDTPPDTLDALLARMSAVLSPLGLS